MYTLALLMIIDRTDFLISQVKGKVINVHGLKVFSLQFQLVF